MSLRHIFYDKLLINISFIRAEACLLLSLFSDLLLG